MLKPFLITLVAVVVGVVIAGWVQKKMQKTT